MDVHMPTRRQLLAAALPLPALAPAAAQPRDLAAVSRALGLIDGLPPQPSQLRAMALANYGHFTTIHVEGTSARGMDFQIRRLQRSTRELFDHELPEAQIRQALREALAGNTARVLVRVNVYGPRLDWMALGRPTETALFVNLSPLVAPTHAPQSVCTVQHERVLPHVKHVGTFGLFHFRREAQRRGFDDALFFNRQGSVSEGTTWNVGFHDGRQFVLPTAPALPGGAMHLLREGMRRQGVPFVERDVQMQELPRMRSAFLTNVPVVYQPILRIDETRYEFPAELHAMLKACYESQPLARSDSPPRTVRRRPVARRSLSPARDRGGPPETPRTL